MIPCAKTTNNELLSLKLVALHLLAIKMANHDNRIIVKKFICNLNEFIWNQIKNFMSPLPISSMHGFLGVGSIAASKA